MAKGSGGSFKAPTGAKASVGSYKQPQNAKGFLAKPKNYIKQIKPARPEPTLKVAPTPTLMKQPKLVR